MILLHRKLSKICWLGLLVTVALFFPAVYIPFLAQASASQTHDASSASPDPAVTVTALSRVQPPMEGYRLPTGQTLVYQVEWRVFNAGTASLRMEAAGREQRLVMSADTDGSVAAVFPVHDRIESFFNPNNFCSLNLSKETEEGFRHTTETVRFDYAKRHSVLDRVNLKKHDTRHEEHDIPNCVVDVLSALYYIGSQTLTPGGSFVFPINDGGKTQNVKITVEKREQIKVPAGTYDTVRVRPEAEDGPLNKKGRALVWFSDDAQHIPVQMEARLFWGTLTLRLLRIEQK